MNEKNELQELEDLLSGRDFETEDLSTDQDEGDEDYSGPALIVGKKSDDVQLFLDYKQLQRDLIFTSNSLSTDFENQAAIFASYSIAKSRAMYQTGRFESEAKVVEATVYEAIRNASAREGTKVTESQLSKLAAVNRKTIAAKEKAIEAKAVEDLCWSAMESLRQRRDMLVQAGADSREDRKGSMIMREEKNPATSKVKAKLSK